MCRFDVNDGMFFNLLPTASGFKQMSLWSIDFLNGIVRNFIKFYLYMRSLQFWNLQFLKSLYAQCSAFVVNWSTDSEVTKVRIKVIWSGVRFRHNVLKDSSIISPSVISSIFLTDDLSHIRFFESNKVSNAIDKIWHTWTLKVPFSPI